jgi:hypothetical protein
MIPPAGLGSEPTLPTAAGTSVECPHTAASSTAQWRARGSPTRPSRSSCDWQPQVDPVAYGLSGRRTDSNLAHPRSCLGRRRSNLPARRESDQANIGWRRREPRPPQCGSGTPFYCCGGGNCLCLVDPRDPHGLRPGHTLCSPISGVAVTAGSVWAWHSMPTHRLWSPLPQAARTPAARTKITRSVSIPPLVMPQA